LLSQFSSRHYLKAHHTIRVIPPPWRISLEKSGILINLSPDPSWRQSRHPGFCHEAWSQRVGILSWRSDLPPAGM